MYINSGRPQLAFDLSLLSLRGCGDRASLSAPYPQGDEEGALPGLKPYKVLKAMGTVREVMLGLLLPA
jgi:hypothetical protein